MKKHVIRLRRYCRIHIPVGRFQLRAAALLFVASLTVMPHAHAIERHLSPLPNASAAAQPLDTHFILSNDPSWITDIFAIGKGSDVVVKLPSCGVPDTLTVSGNGTALRRDAGRSPAVCSNGFFLINGGNADVNVLTIARHTGGMRLFLPGLRYGLNAYGQSITLKGAINVAPTADKPDTDVTRIWLYQEGTKAGPVTFIVYDANGNEVAREYPTQKDAKGKVIPAATPGQLVSYALETQLPSGGTVAVTLGLRLTGAGAPGFNSPNDIPDGTVYLFMTYGPESGKSAPYVVVPASVQ